MYVYREIKPAIFTDKGQRKLLKVRDHIDKCIKMSGAITMEEAISTVSGDSWESMACVDRLVELEELKEVNYEKCAGQHRIFIAQ